MNNNSEKKRSIMSLDEMLFQGSNSVETSSKPLDIQEEQTLKNDTEPSKQSIPIELIDPLENHKYKLYDGTKLDAWVENIKKHGILTPVILQPKENGRFRTIAGHNRINGAHLAGINEIDPDKYILIDSDLPMDEVMDIVHITNLYQRSPSDMGNKEKVYAFKQYFDILKNRTNNYESIGEEFQDSIEENYNISVNTLRIYWRISNMDEYFVDLFDKNDLSLRVIAVLSHLNEHAQSVLKEVFISEPKLIKMKDKKAIELKKNCNHSRATVNDMIKILTDHKKPSKVKVSLNTAFLNKYFDLELDSSEDIIKVIDTALTKYFNKEESINEESET
jgi:ParB family chromosome partitioning protein